MPTLDEYIRRISDTYDAGDPGSGALERIAISIALLAREVRDASILLKNAPDDSNRR